MVTLLRRHRYELVALLTGACVMILEIVGARLIAPYFGTSTYVWTAMIGVILGSLSLGLWYGGKLADKYNSKQDLGLIITMAALLVLATSLLQEPVLQLISKQQLDLRLSSLIAATVLFAPPSILIGMVSPHLAKLRVTSLKTTGTTIGRLEAAGAIGSIGGTFLSGYWLLAYFGVRNVTLWLVILLVLTSFLANRRTLVWSRLVLIAVTLLLTRVSGLPSGIISDTDSAHNRYQVLRRESADGRQINLLIMDRQGIQSAAYVDDPTEPVFPYAKSMIKVVANANSVEKILMIGGGAHTVPTILGTQFPATQIDVAEIDRALDGLSREFFGYTDRPNISIHYEDGRTYINQRSENYDLILMDAFTSLTPPFHLVSREAVEKLARNLNPDGALVINAPTFYDGEFLPSLQKTYATVFPYVAIYPAEPYRSLSEEQNFIIIATRNEAYLQKLTKGFPEQLQPPKKGIVLTDNYAPVERLAY